MGVVVGNARGSEQAFDITYPPPVDRLHGGSRSRIDRGPAADRVFKRPLLAEYPVQQNLQRVVLFGRGVDVGDNPLGGNIAPKPEQLAMKGFDVGEVPVKAAARHAHRFRQRHGLERRKTLLGKGLQPVVQPVRGGELLNHLSSPAASSPYTTVLTAPESRRMLAIHWCMEAVAHA